MDMTLLETLNHSKIVNEKVCLIKLFSFLVKDIIHRNAKKNKKL